MKVYTLVHTLHDETLAGPEEPVSIERVVGVYSTMGGARRAAKTLVDEIFAKWPENAREKVIPLNNEGDFCPQHCVYSSEEEPEIANLDIPVLKLDLELLRGPFSDYAKFYKNCCYDLCIGVVEKAGHRISIFSSELE